MTADPETAEVRDEAAKLAVDTYLATCPNVLACGVQNKESGCE